VLTPHGGVLFDPVAGKGAAKRESEWGASAQLLVEHLRDRYAQVRLTHAPAVLDLRPFAWAGWDVRVRYTYHLEASDPSDRWERLEGRTRTVVRKAEQAGYRVGPTADVGLFGRLYGMVYAGRDRAPVPAPVATAFAAQALAAGLAEGLKVESPAGEVAAVVLFVSGFELVYAWVAGADPRLGPSGATSLLYWRFLEQNPGRRFDLVGANLPAIALFKRGFGGELVPYYAVEGFGSRWARALARGRRLLP
jgi:hypothetical protein